MQIPIPSQHRAFALRVTLRASEPFDLAVRVFDPTKANTFYISRRIPFRADLLEHAEGERSFRLQFPQSPELLVLELTDRDFPGSEGFEVVDLQVERLPEPVLCDFPEIHRFAAFAEQFAARAGYTAPGFYDAPNHEYLIEYLPQITDVIGRPIGTPARINRRTGRIQVSAAQFRRYTVPVRLFILLHERFHRVLNTRRERPPDRGAIRTYMELGYPGTEGLYAATKVFLDHDGPIGKDAWDRVRAIGRFIDHFNGKQEQSIIQVNKAA